MIDKLYNKCEKTCVTINNEGCIYENICPNYNPKPSNLNEECLTINKQHITQSENKIL